MDLILRALTFSRSTILFGPLGRYPTTIQFYMDSIPELEPITDDEAIFLHRPSSRILHVCIEPPFGETLPPGRWTLVFTSHLYLRWNRIAYRSVQNYHIPMIRPPNLFGGSKVLDLSKHLSTHEAYLALCNFLDASSGEWSLSCPEALRKELRKTLPELGGGPYNSYLLTVFG